ncbi:MAG: MFS transporter [Bacteroidetes bacterium]|nr:MFS transporter [Bacteroidota bacterium]
MTTQNIISKNPLNIVVIVASLGYFVDIYDLILFGIVRVPSLKGIGVPDEQLLEKGIYLLNMQMIGMLLGGILWGIMGDKKGRLPVLFFTISLYSIANIANGFVTNMEQYAILRFFAGLGLAGELGIGITLVAEVMTKETRGYGTTLVSGIGIAGAVLGFLVADLFNWRIAYFVGGGLGLLLLLLRASVYESGMFKKTKEVHKHIKRGNFLSLFTSRKRLLKYIYCILIGVPVWFVIAILVIQSPEFSKALHINGHIDGGAAIMWHYVGASLGSFATGLLSQWLSSRRKAIFIAFIFLIIFTAVYFSSTGFSAVSFYIILVLLGIAQGYWAVFITTASEQFGTNLRATVTTTVPNFVRGATIPITFAILFLKNKYDLLTAGIIVGTVCIGLALVALHLLEETFHKDLDYHED